MKGSNNGSIKIIKLILLKEIYYNVLEDLKVMNIIVEMFFLGLDGLVKFFMYIEFRFIV